MGEPKDNRRRRRSAHSSAKAGGEPAQPPGQEKPAWAEGIRQLYDAVTEEPLPVEFQTLLNQLGKLPKE